LGITGLSPDVRFTACDGLHRCEPSDCLLGTSSGNQPFIASTRRKYQARHEICRGRGVCPVVIDVVTFLHALPKQDRHGGWQRCSAPTSIILRVQWYGPTRGPRGRATAASRLQSDGAPHLQIPQSRARLTTGFLVAGLRVLRIKGRGRQTHNAIHWLAGEFLWHFFGRTASQHRHNYAFSHDSFNDMIFINNVVISVPQN
jgi:hypothetical protein